MSGELVPFQGRTDLQVAPVMSMTEMLEVGKALHASGWFRDIKDAGQAVVKIMLGSELGVSPLTAMRGIYVLETSRGPVIQLAGDLLAKLMKAHGYTWSIDRLDDTGCELTVYSNGRKLGEVAFTQAQAKKAGLLGKAGPWSQYTEDMYWARAIARAQKRYAPEVTGGFPMPVVEAEVVETLPASDEQMVALRASAFRIFGDDREGRLRWASMVLGREVATFSARHDLTRGEVSGLLNAIEGDMFKPDQADLNSPSESASAGPVEGPAEMSVGEAEDLVGEGESTGKGTASPTADVQEDRTGRDEGSSGVAEGEAVAPEVQAGAQTEPPRPTPAPSRSHNKPESAKAAVERVREHQAVASETRRRVTEAAPPNWLQTLPPEARYNLLTFFDKAADPEGVAETASKVVARKVGLPELAKWTADTDWSDEQLKTLANETWGRK